MADVAKRAGVSRMTVSRALRAGTTISPETRAKIVAAADALGYVTDATASGFATGRSGFVAMTIPSIDNANFAATVRGVTEELRAVDLQLLVGCTNYDIDEEERLIEGMLSRRPDAVIVTGGVHTDRCRRLLSAYDAPIVETWDLPQEPLGHVVGFSNYDGGALMADHLYATGRRKLGFIGGAPSVDTRGADRRRGFLARLAALGLETHRVVTDVHPKMIIAEGARAFDTLISAWPDTEAVMCMADPAAFGALSAAKRRGLSTPGAIAIAGFGAYDIGAYADPQITTIDTAPAEIGRRAAAVIWESLNQPLTDAAADPNQARQHVATMSLIARASTAAV